MLKIEQIEKVNGVVQCRGLTPTGQPKMSDSTLFLRFTWDSGSLEIEQSVWLKLSKRKQNLILKGG